MASHSAAPKSGPFATLGRLVLWLIFSLLSFGALPSAADGGHTAADPCEGPVGFGEYLKSGLREDFVSLLTCAVGLFICRTTVKQFAR